jgi:RecA-family ATPase
MRTTIYVPPEGTRASPIDGGQQPAARSKKTCNGEAPPNLGAGPEHQPNAAAQELPKFRRIINPIDWEGLLVPPREWIVPDYIPHKTVTLLSGDGSIGKSLLALQLAVARAIAREWIGLLPEPGLTLILSAEDDADEMHRRVEDIRKFYGVSMAGLADIRLVDLVGEDSILGSLMRGQIEPTKIYDTLAAYLTEWRPSLVILDVLADMFSGDENSRPQSRQFIGLLKRLARKHSCAFLLLAHPSLTGLNTGTGTSGSTGWSNAVRSRLYFQTAKASDGSEPNPNLRSLQGMKSNYGVPGGKIDLEWQKGLFVPVQGATGLDKIAAEAKVDAVFLGLLKRVNTQGRNVSTAKGPTYAPAVFAAEPDNHDIKSRDFDAAMRRLLNASRIRVEVSGPASRRRSALVLED